MLIGDAIYPRSTILRGSMDFSCRFMCYFFYKKWYDKKVCCVKRRRGKHLYNLSRISFFNYQFCTDVYDKKVIIKCSYAEKTKKIWVEDTEGKVHDLWLLEDSETDTQMPKVLQNLVEKTFMSDGKRYRPPLPEQKLRRRKKTA